MAIDYTLTVKKIHSLEKIYVLFSASTRMPFVECDPEEFDDQIYIFANEELATAAAKAYADCDLFHSGTASSESEEGRYGPHETLTGVRGRDDCGSGTFPFYSGSGFLQGRG